MGCKRSYAYQRLTTCLLTEIEKTRSTVLETELKLLHPEPRIQLNGIAQFGKHLSIVLKASRQLLKNLIAGRYQLALTLTALVDMGYLVTSQIKTGTEEFRSQHIVEISNSCKPLGCQPTVKGIQTLHTMILFLQVCLHETYVGSQSLKERSHKSLAEHRNTDVRILLCQGRNHRYGHGYITQGGESNNKYMLCLQCLIFKLTIQGIEGALISCTAQD